MASPPSVRSRTAASISPALSPRRQHVARHPRRARAPSGGWSHSCVTPTSVGPSSEREQQLGGVGDEAHDPHGLTVRATRAAVISAVEMTPLPDAEIEQRLTEIGGWHRGEGSSIVRELNFADFAAAIAFVNSVAELAEAANHHPDILVHG